MSSDRKVGVAVLAIVAIIVGVIVAINAASEPFLASRGQQLWRLFAMNTAGGLLTALGGFVAFGSVFTRLRVPALLAGLGFLGIATVTSIALQRSFNIVGGRASTVSFLLMLGLGFTVLAISPEVPVPSSGGLSQAERDGAA